MRIRARALLLSAAVAAPLAVAGFAAPAQAAPAECTKTVTMAPTSKPNVPRSTATATCASGTGQYRIVMKCIRNISGSIWVNSTLYGPWATAGPNTSSTVSCAGPYTATGIEFG